MKIPNIEFPTDFKSIWNRIESIDPKKYAKTRNFIWGSVTYLSPYVSRGVISVEDIRKVVISKVESPWEIEKFIQELAWREYWQRIWLEKGDAIFGDLKRSQDRRNADADLEDIPHVIDEFNTGITALDRAIEHMKETGYMHNHLRMYLASVWCNVGGYSWLSGAKWMHYYLLDGDLASNWLSWQWVSGTNSSKLYFCNQENINTYCGTRDTNTFLDHSYEYLSRSPLVIPDSLLKKSKKEYPQSPDFGDTIVITKVEELILNQEDNMFVYHWYHLDPRWFQHDGGNRILVLESSFFNRFPVSPVAMKFALALALEIPNIQIFYGEFSDVKRAFPETTFITREHPLVNGWGVRTTPRLWMSTPSNAEGSFFNYWKKASREIMMKPMDGE